MQYGLSALCGFVGKYLINIPQRHKAHKENLAIQDLGRLQSDDVMIFRNI